MSETTTNNYRYWIYFFGLFLMAVGLPLSKFLMSVSQIILAANWLADKRVLQKFGAFFRNRSALVLASLLLLHFMGLLWSQDWKYGWDDIRIKAPLLIFPVIISTSPVLDKKHFHWLMGLLIAAITLSTLVSMGVLHGFILTKKCPYPIVEIRDISIFISHIRLSLLICVAFFLLAWYIFYTKNRWLKLVFILTAAWLVEFLVILESLTGLVILGITAGLLLGYFVMKQAQVILKISFVVITASAVAFGALYLHHVFRSVAAIDPVKVEFSKLDKKTSRGNNYVHDSLENQIENGNYVRQYICFEELKQSWPTRSRMSIEGKDSKGNYIMYTIIRYMTSKGLHKDADGMTALSEEDIHNIERGVANVNYADASSLTVRIKQAAWEWDNYSRGGNPNGHSITQRFEYWKCAARIIRENIFFGVGTGDMEIAYGDQYKKMGSRLMPEWQLHSHNQFLSIAVGFGILGLGWFLFAIFYPAFHENKFADYFFATFFIIAFLSFMNEDTLESQAGVSFFAFFYCLFLFRKM